MAPQGPIQHVVVIFKENHCFDNYFGTFSGANGVTMAHSPNPPTQGPHPAGSQLFENPKICSE